MSTKCAYAYINTEHSEYDYNTILEWDTQCGHKAIDSACNLECEEDNCPFCNKPISCHVHMRGPSQLSELSYDEQPHMHRTGESPRVVIRDICGDYHLENELVTYIIFGADHGHEQPIRQTEHTHIALNPIVSVKTSKPCVANNHIHPDFKITKRINNDEY